MEIIISCQIKFFFNEKRHIYYFFFLTNIMKKMLFSYFTNIFTNCEIIFINTIDK